MKFWKKDKSSDEVYLQVQSLFNDLELVEDFKRFLPSATLLRASPVRWGRPGLRGPRWSKQFVKNLGIFDYSFGLGLVMS